MIRRLGRAARGDPTTAMLLPMMEAVPVRDGEVIFRKGDMADRLYYVQEGRVEVVEFGKMLEAGALFGEVGLLSEGKTRTATVRAVGDAMLCEIDRASVLRTCREHPDFALMIARLITDRLVENQEVLDAQVAEMRAGRIG
jgi:CRP-like cAMP-binding protein